MVAEGLNIFFRGKNTYIESRKLAVFDDKFQTIHSFLLKAMLTVAVTATSMG